MNEKLANRYQALTASLQVLNDGRLNRLLALADKTVQNIVFGVPESATFTEREEALRSDFRARYEEKIERARSLQNDATVKARTAIGLTAGSGITAYAAIMSVPLLAVSPAVALPASVAAASVALCAMGRAWYYDNHSRRDLAADWTLKEMKAEIKLNSLTLSERFSAVLRERSAQIRDSMKKFVDHSSDYLKIKGEMFTDKLLDSASHALDASDRAKPLLKSWAARGLQVLDDASKLVSKKAEKAEKSVNSMLAGFSQFMKEHPGSAINFVATSRLHLDEGNDETDSAKTDSALLKFIHQEARDALDAGETEKAKTLLGKVAGKDTQHITTARMDLADMYACIADTAIKKGQLLSESASKNAWDSGQYEAFYKQKEFAAANYSEAVKIVEPLLTSANKQVAQQADDYMHRLIYARWGLTGDFDDKCKSFDYFKKVAQDQGRPEASNHAAEILGLEISKDSGLALDFKLHPGEVIAYCEAFGASGETGLHLTAIEKAYKTLEMVAEKMWNEGNKQGHEHLTKRATAWVEYAALRGHPDAVKRVNSANSSRDHTSVSDTDATSKPIARESNSSASAWAPSPSLGSFFGAKFLVMQGAHNDPVIDNTASEVKREKRLQR
jgi:hypothetical protein